MNGDSLERIVQEWWWKFGRPAEIWTTHLDVVGNTIKKLNLAPLSREHYPATVISQQTPMAGYQAARVTRLEPTQAEEIIPLDYRGGLRSPHLHFKRDIYLLNNQQWKTFSNSIVEDFKEKLSQIGTVSFEQLVKTSEVIDSLV